MRSRLIISALVGASLLGAPVIAFAQNEPAKPETTTSSQGTKAPAHHKMHSAHMSSHMKAGTTTGMSSGKARPGGQSVSRKPSGS
jgi:uncharacterized low-complexity protein